MKLNLRIEFKYAVLISLLMMLWLCLEYMVGLHKEPLIKYHPFVTMFALIIPIVCSRLAIKEKREQLNGQITFKRAFMTGFLIAIFGAMLAIPTQLAFHKLINPDFFDNMINYAVKNGKETKEAATMYFNLNSYLMQSVFGTLIFGTIIALIMAWRMRTVK